MKKFNKKGFTLAELLVVVAIIAILVAVAIPTFSAAQTKAYKGVAEANSRSAYAEWAITYIADETAPKEGDTITYTTGGKTTVCEVKSVDTSNDNFKLTISATVDSKDGGEYTFDSTSLKNTKK